MMCFWGGDNCTLLLMHKEALSRAGAQDADTAALATTLFLRSEESQGKTDSLRWSLYPLPFFCGDGCSGKSGGRGGCWAVRSEFGRAVEELVGGGGLQEERESLQ